MDSSHSSSLDNGTDNNQLRQSFNEPSKETAALALSPAAPTLPEGGLQAWLTVAGGSMVLFSTFGMIQSFGVFQDFYTRVTLDNRSPSDISWIGSVQVFLLFAISVFSGQLFDLGYFRHLLFFGTILYVFSFFMLSLAEPHHFYQNFLAQGIGIGIGMGVIFLPSLSIVSHYFRARRSVATGVLFGGSSLGGVLFPIMLNRLFEGKAGFGWGVRAAAFLVLGLLIIANLTMKTRLPKKSKRAKDVIKTASVALRDIPYMTCTIGACITFWGLFVPFFYLQLFATQHGVESNIAFYAVTILNAASFFGRTLPNFVADAYGVFPVIIPMTFISGCLVFVMLAATTVRGMVLFAIFYGFFSGAFISLISPTIVKFARSIEEVGVRLGIAMFLMSFALLTGSPVAGAVLNPPKDAWVRPITFSGVVVIAGSLIMAISWVMESKRKGTWLI